MPQKFECGQVFLKQILARVKPLGRNVSNVVGLRSAGAWQTGKKGDQDPKKRVQRVALLLPAWRISAYRKLFGWS
jgi:hypothetical protein